MDHSEIARILTRSLADGAEPPSFLPLLDGIRDALAVVGLRADRVQLPMSRMAGFRHPTYGLVLATWSREDGYAGSEVMTHAFLDSLGLPGVVGTPFEGIVLRGEPFLSTDLGEDDLGIAMLGKLRDRGYRGYVAIGLPMPVGDFQPLSIASKDPFPDDVTQRLEPLRALIAMTVYAAYRTSQAVRMAEAYIGRESGPRVLAGEIQRGSTRQVEAGIVFCDIRGFTALSEQLGAEGVVRVVNEVFAVVGKEAEARGGEILKFIGDAMLIVFEVGGDRQAVARAMVETARASIAEVEALDEHVRVGFGGHIGTVVQGNIGTPTRLDFTVMGPAVNLASRLEGLCKPLGANAVFSDTVAEVGGDLRPGGAHAVKGVSAPVEVLLL